MTAYSWPWIGTVNSRDPNRLVDRQQAPPDRDTVRCQILHTAPPSLIAPSIRPRGALSRQALPEPPALPCVWTCPAPLLAARHRFFDAIDDDALHDPELATSAAVSRCHMGRHLHPRSQPMLGLLDLVAGEGSILGVERTHHPPPSCESTMASLGRTLASETSRHFRPSVPPSYHSMKHHSDDMSMITPTRSLTSPFVLLNFL